MNNVYLVIENSEPELLSVDFNFFNQARPGDCVKVKEVYYEIETKIYDPQEMDLYIKVDNQQWLIGNKSKSYYIDLIKKGQKLQAVKEYKDEFGCGLKEAKDFIDNLQDENKINYRY